jgi:hypothetical protein
MNPRCGKAAQICSTLKQEPQFIAGTRVRIARVAFPNLPSHQQYLGKSGVVLRHDEKTGSVVVLLDDGSTRVCFAENLELD